jgi:hypothetical protein
MHESARRVRRGMAHKTRGRRKHLGYGRPAVDREARSDVLLVGDIAYPHCTAEQRGPCTGEEERGDGLEVNIGIWRDL